MRKLPARDGSIPLRRRAMVAAVTLGALLPSAVAAAGETAGTARGIALTIPRGAPGFTYAAVEMFGGQPAQSSQSGSTAQELRAMREAKRRRPQAPAVTFVEAGLKWLEDGHWLQRVRQGWHGFLPTLGGFPSGSGQAFGVAWSKNALGVRYPRDSTPNRIDLRGAAAASLRGSYLGLFQVGAGRLGGTPLHANFHVGLQQNGNESLYGIGPDSLESDRTSFSQIVGAVGGTVWWRTPTWLSLGGGVGFREIGVDIDSDEIPPSAGFRPDAIPGFTDTVDYLSYDAFALVDWRNPGNPYRGGLYAVRWTGWNDRGTDAFSFTELDIEVQQNFPYLKNKRVVALRGRTILTDARPGSQVPFYLMPTLGGTRDLRGYSYARFRDRNMVLLNAEYRAEIWLMLDLALFVDAGKVFAERSAWSLTDLEYNYGVGLRIKTTLSTFVRADFAFGGEGFHTAITFDNAFDTAPLFTRLLQTVR